MAGSPGTQGMHGMQQMQGMQQNMPGQHQQPRSGQPREVNCLKCQSLGMVGYDPTPCNHCGALNQLCACRNCGKLAILESGTTCKCSHCHEKLEPSGGFVRQPSQPHGGVFGTVSAPGQMAYEGPGYDGNFRMGRGAEYGSHRGPRTDFAGAGGGGSDMGDGSHIFPSNVNRAVMQHGMGSRVPEQMGSGGVDRGGSRNGMYSQQA